MKVFELSVKVYCQKNIPKARVLEQIAGLIDFSLMESENLKELHTQNTYKYYSFNALYPLAQNGIYEEGKIYTFIIRTLDERLQGHFMKVLVNGYHSTLKVLTVTCKTIAKRHIYKLYTVTPLILKFDGYWRGKQSIDVFEKRVKENLIKKYNGWTETKMEEDFDLFIHLAIDNQKPIAFDYKDIRLLGDKVTLHIADNERAQRIAYMAIASGLGELGARGAGFVNYKFL